MIKKVKEKPPNIQSTCVLYEQNHYILIVKKKHVLKHGGLDESFWL